MRGLAFVLLAGLLAPGAAPAAENAASEAELAGRLVSSVRLELLPEEAAALERYLSVRAGAPFDPAQARRSVSLLFATGRFADVAVLAQPVADGLEVVFRPTPAPRMTALVLEGDRVLDEKQLLRASRLSWGEPLWPARLEEAARDVGLALAARGYLEGRARVEATPRADGSAASFRIDAGPRAYVRGLRAVGMPPEAPDATPRLRPKRGQPFRREQSREAASRLEGDLRALGRWRASVAVEESYDPRVGRVDLLFRVEPGPRCSLAFEGSRLPAGLRAEVEERLREEGLRPDALEEASDRIQQVLEERGHRSPRASWHEESDAGGTLVRFVIEAGAQAEVASVEITGWQPAEGAPSLATRPGESLREATIEADVATLLRLLREAGHAEAQVEAEVAEGGGLTPVRFRVRPGPRTLVSRVELTGAPADLELPALRVVAGQPLRMDDVARDRAALLGALHDRGFLRAEAAPEIATEQEPPGARVSYALEPGEQVRIGEIVVAGLRDTRETVVRRELRVAEGDPLGAAALRESQRRLQALGLFERVVFRELDPGAPRQRRLALELAEGPRTAVAYGLGYSERDLLRASVEVTRRNLNGLDRTLSTFARISFRSSRLLASFREPRLLGRKQELFLTAFREDEDRDSFDFVRHGLLAQTARDIAPRLSLITRYVFQRTRTFNIEVPIEEIDREFQSSLFSGPSASLVFDTRDDPLDPRRGGFAGLDAQVSSTLLGGDDFGKTFLQASVYRPLSARLVLATGARLGLGWTYGEAPPQLALPDRFYAGGDYSLRGYAVDAVDPSGGNALVLVGTELRVDLGRRLSLATFAEAGNTYPLVADLDLGELLYTAGVGLRYKSAFGPLRVDWGFKLNPRAGDDPWRVHLTIGHAF
ncbi:MAG: BamA/TamA family outer membrane protein [Vicinamibacteria bacterium]